jgi:hypothetical protein
VLASRSPLVLAGDKARSDSGLNGSSMRRFGVGSMRVVVVAWLFVIEQFIGQVGGTNRAQACKQSPGRIRPIFWCESIKNGGENTLCVYAFHAGIIAGNSQN